MRIAIRVAGRNATLGLLLAACSAPAPRSGTTAHGAPAAGVALGTAPASSLALTAQALFVPFTQRYQGDLVVAVFDRETIEVITIRGDARTAPRQIYPLGSQAKLVVAMTAVTLASEGRLDLDRPIGELAEGLPEAASSLTLRELLTHHGGLVFEPPSWQPPTGAYGAADLLLDLEAHPPAGRTYRYSNFGYMVAAHVIEQHLEASFRDASDRQLRLLMEGRPGTLGFAIDDALPRAALFDEDGDAPERTVEPYLRWSCCLLEGNVLGLAGLGQHLLAASGPGARVLIPHRARAAGWGYAGMGTFQSPDGSLVYNQGAMPGAYSALALDLRERRGAAIVSATNGPGTGGLLLRTLALLRVLRGDSAAPRPTPAMEASWRMAHPPQEDAWWSLRPEAFSTDGHGILVGAPHNATLWLRRPLPAAGTIRVRVVPLTASIDIKLDLLAPAMGLSAFGEDDVAGYRLILGGWDNTRSVLVAAPSEARVVWDASGGEESRPSFAAGRPIELEVRYDRARIDVRLDDAPWFVVDRVDPAGENEPRFVGFAGWSSPALVQEVAVDPAAASSE